MNRLTRLSWAICASALLLVPLPLHAAGDTTSTCIKSFLGIRYGWNDDCLVGLLRSADYFSIEPADASDADLLAYVQDKRDLTVYTLASIDHGRALDQFVHHSVPMPSNTEGELLRAAELVDKAHLDQLGQLIRIVGLVMDLPVAQVASEWLGTLSRVAEGYTIYQKLAGAITTFNRRAMLQFYFDTRDTNTATATWTDLYQVYSPILDEIRAINLAMTESEEATWFENAYQGYRLAGKSNSMETRQQIGHAIAALASPKPAPQPPPTIRIVKRTSAQGTTFEITAENFTPGHDLQLFFKAPNDLYRAFGAPTRVPPAGLVSWSVLASCSASTGSSDLWSFVARDSSDWLIGDFNGDGIVNSIDWSLLNQRWFTDDPFVDINHDGIVNSIDYSMMNSNWFKTRPATGASAACQQ